KDRLTIPVFISSSSSRTERNSGSTKISACLCSQSIAWIKPVPRAGKVGSAFTVKTTESTALNVFFPVSLKAYRSSITNHDTSLYLHLMPVHQSVFFLQQHSTIRSPLFIYFQIK